MAEDFFLVSYDISNPKRLYKVHKAMLDFGHPRQYSVFECRLSELNLVRLRARIADLINDKEDQVIIIRLCERCAAGIEAVGRRRVEDDPNVQIL
jgi:CRISPR-associated protein Cas2